MIQDGSDGLRSPILVVQGGSITVNVGPNDNSIDVSVVGGERITISVAPDKDAVVTIPALPPGSIVLVSVGNGLRTRVIGVEVIATSP